MSNNDSHESQSSEARFEFIRRELLQGGRVNVPDLAARLDVSPATIRRDLTSMEARGFLKRVYGGAVAIEPLMYEPFRYESNFHKNLERYSAEKQRIGLAGADLVQEGEVVSLMSGTTSMYLARALRHRHNITVLTNTVNVAMELNGREGITVVMTGGVLRGNFFSLVGPLAELSLRQIYVDRVFIGMTAIDVTKGLTTTTLEQATVIRAMIEQAKKRIVIADSSKLGSVSHVLICPVHNIQQIITDTGASAEQITAFQEAGIEVTLV
jgi:DeoR family transcriptional regulator of aga operon